MTVAALNDRYLATAYDIFEFAKELNFHPTSQQADVMADVHNGTFDFGPRKIAAKSGQGVGKTGASVVAGLWRAWRAGDAKTFVTAPTMRQCRDVWLVEAAKRIENSNSWIRDRIRCTGSRIIIGNRIGQWGVNFFTATKAENAQGLHNPFMTIICEEASGIPAPLIEQIDGTIKNQDYIWLQIGNPNSRLCKFFDCFSIDREKWQTRTFDARQSPLCDPKKVAEDIAKYGADSDFVRVRIYGEFPSIDPDTVMGADELEKCSTLDYLRLALTRSADGRMLRQIGLDFARYGGDENVIWVRLGYATFKWTFHPKTDPNLVINFAFELQAQLKWSNADVLYVADATGMGQSLMYRFYRAGKRVMEFHNHGVSSREEYDNLITEAYFNLRDLVRAGRVYLPNDPILIKQLSTRKYWLTNDGKIILESKDDYMKRGYDSPDRADACAMAFYEPKNARALIARVEEAGRNLGLVVRRSA